MRTHFRGWGARRMRRAMTLVEMLVAMTLSLMLVAALAQAFQFIGINVSDGRARLNMANQMRGVTHLLQKDLEGVTVPLLPWTRETAGLGYFEIIEGTTYDSSNVATDTLVGDYDDILCFTARTTGEPFRGRYNGNVIESNVAEIIWWLSLEDENGDGVWSTEEDFFLHRRVLLVRPDLPNPLPAGAGTGTAFFQNNDVSARPSGVNMIANSLGDLTDRQSRFAHASAFPNVISRNATTLLLDSNYILSGTYKGEDVALSHVLGFDVRVYDPGARVKVATSGELVTPGDPGYAAAGASTTLGAFVDLGITTFTGSGVTTADVPNFGGSANALSKLVPPTCTSRVYCTWSQHYEHNGVNEDGDAVVDEGEDGLDNDNMNGVDDPGERETAPPYPIPLRGVQVTIRMVDHGARQVRQARVVQRFTSE